jgi:hypothetical protein
VCHSKVRDWYAVTCPLLLNTPYQPNPSLLEQFCDGEARVCNTINQHVEHKIKEVEIGIILIQSIATLNKYGGWRTIAKKITRINR